MRRKALTGGRGGAGGGAAFGAAAPPSWARARLRPAGTKKPTTRPPPTRAEVLRNVRREVSWSRSRMALPLRQLGRPVDGAPDALVGAAAADVAGEGGV